MRRLIRIAWCAFLGLVVLAGAAVAARPLGRAGVRAMTRVTNRFAWERARGEGGAAPAGGAAAWLKIPRADVNAIVLRGITRETLARGPGLDRPRQDRGPQLVAAHRDTHFRRLGRLQPGDRIEWQAREGGTVVYVVERVEIVDPDESVRRVSRCEDPRAIVLMTCYPFRWIGPAPQRYLVWARPDGRAK